MPGETVNPAVEQPAEPKVVYQYTVSCFDNGLYDFEGVVLPGTEVPCIDKYNIAKDIINLGRKLDHQLIVEEAQQRMLEMLNNLAAQAPDVTADDPTKA